MLNKRTAVAIVAVVCFLAALLMGPAALAAGANKCDGGHSYSVAAPTSLKAVSVTDTEASLKWSAPKNARGIKGYNIYRGGMLVGTAAGTSYTDTGLTPNEYYTWTVKAYDACRRLSCASNSVTAATFIIIREAVEWSPDTAPASVNGGLIVEETGFLQIDPGVVVKIVPCKSVTVAGTINAAGGADAPIVFTSTKDKAYGGRGVKSGSDYWNTIAIASGGSFTGGNVKIVYGSTLINVKGMLSLTDSEVGYAKTMGILVDTAGEFDGIGVKLHDCCEASSCRGLDVKGVVDLTSSQVYDCPGTGVLIETTGTFNGTSVSISNCSKGVEVRGNINFVLSSVSGCDYGLYFNALNPSGVILNSLMGNNKYGVYNSRAGDVTIDASMNWWGSADGPSVYDPATQTWSTAGDRVSAGVIYDNWLTEPAQ
jgi:hypothetical protein